MGRRSYAGAGVATFLTAPVITTDIIFLIDSSQGWPTGASGPMAAVIDRDEANEEKVLLSEVNAGTAVASIRGYDGTTAKNHSAFATFELCMTAIDSDEANFHVNSVSGVHGLAPTDRVVGESRAATLSNKSMSGADNTFSAIPLSASPETEAVLDALAQDILDEETARIAADDLLQDNIDAEALARGNADTTLQDNIDAEALARANADTALGNWDTGHLAAGDPHPQYMTSAEVDAAIAAAAPTDSGWIVSLTGWTLAAGWNAASVRFRYTDIGPLTLAEVFFQVTRSGAAINNPTSGNIGNVVIFSAVPTAIRPIGATIGGQGPGDGTGRPVNVSLSAAGVVELCGLGGSSDLANNETISGSFFYMI
jgi:hypothetical protein